MTNNEKNKAPTKPEETKGTATAVPKAPETKEVPKTPEMKKIPPRNRKQSLPSLKTKQRTTPQRKLNLAQKKL